MKKVHEQIYNIALNRKIPDRKVRQILLMALDKDYREGRETVSEALDRFTKLALMDEDRQRYESGKGIRRPGAD